jgi:hypothetical protein
MSLAPHARWELKRMAPPLNATVFCVDENSAVQTLDRLANPRMTFARRKRIDLERLHE